MKELEKFLNSISECIDNAIEIGKNYSENKIILDTNIESIGNLDRVVENIRNAYQKEKINEDIVWNISISLGTLLGEMIINKYGFKWGMTEKGIPIVEKDKDNKLYPITKIYKIILSNEDSEETLSSFYKNFIVFTKVLNNKLEKEIVRKDKIHISDVIVIIGCFLMSLVGFYGYFEPNAEKDSELLVIGILFIFIFLFLFIGLIVKRPYFKMNSIGINTRELEYVKEKFIAWDKVDAIIGPDKIYIINKELKKIEESELNGENISKLDVYKKQLDMEECECEAEWLRNSISIVIKKENGIDSDVYPIVGGWNNIKVEELIKMWNEYIEK